MTKIHAMPMAICLALAACGGGGSAAPEPAAAPACSPAVVRIQFFGDSTNLYGAWETTRDALRARFGQSIMVESRAVSGMTTDQLLAGTDGLNKPWPGSVAPGSITLVNDGINDAVAAPIEQYKANLRRLRPSYFETPNPTDSPLRPYDGTATYAQAMRDVAVETGVPLIDIHTYVISLPNWRALLVDGIHPGPVLTEMIGTNVVYPALVPAVAKLRCE